MEIDEKKKRVVQEIQALPTLPVVMMKILECIDDPHSSAKDLKDIITNDISISTKVLSLANSAFYGYARTIEDITRAIVVLGFETIIDVALSVSLNSILSPAGDCFEISMEEFWKHSMATGEAGRLCAKKELYPYSERAFLIGLTHDVGKIALACFFQTEFNNAIKNSLAKDTFIYNTEKNSLGFSHSDAGGWLAEKWNLPPTILIPIQFHHKPENAPPEFQREAILAHLADYLAKHASIGNSGDNNKLPELSPLVHSQLKINEDKIKTLAENLEKLKPKIDAFVGTVL